MSIQVQAAQRPWYAHRWPWLLMLGPAIVVVAGSYTGYLAFSNPDPLVVGDYYKRGKAINQDLRRDRAATERAMALTLNYDAVTGILGGAVRSKGAASSEALVLRLAHATLPAKDLRFVVQPDAHGQFSLSLPMLERSRWQVVAEGDQQDWRLEGHWAWPTQRGVDIVADAPI
jgi:hypothetical protein